MAQILLIDDDIPLRQQMAAALVRAGHTVVETADGVDAMRVLREQPRAFDLTITDLVMPRQEGIQTIQEIRQLNPQARIIATSGTPIRHPEVYLRTARLLGASHTLFKPFTPQTLLATVDAALSAAPAPDMPS
jgi:DNA-binding response OmpR family regulator